MAQLFLDLDGVLADFESGAQDLLKMTAKDYQAKYGPGGFWKRLASAPDFYGGLQLLPDAMELYHAVQHVDPIILTGLPIGKWAEPQKRAWAARHFPGVHVITTLARKKSTYCEPGDAGGRQRPVCGSVGSCRWPLHPPYFGHGKHSRITENRSALTVAHRPQLPELWVH